VRVLRRQHGKEDREEAAWLKGKLYIVENVEAEVCGQCGEKYFHAKTLDAIDQLLQSEHQVSGLMNVEVVTMQ